MHTEVAVMKIRKTKCDSCGGVIDFHVANGCSKIFCPYCGQQYQIDVDRRVVLISKDIHITNRKIDEADIIRAKSESYKARSKWKVFALILALPIISFCALFVYDVTGMDEYIKEQSAEQQGKIHAGWSATFSGMHYQAVEQYFRELGFENITTIDLNDANGKDRKEGIIDTISINGDAYFSDDDYFKLSDKIIIMYH